MIKVAHVDLDAFKYSCASVGEERSILVTHKQSGREKEFKTRTEFWGHHKKKQGGWLAEVNKNRLEDGLEPFTSDDFDIRDVQKVVEPIENILHTCKVSVESALHASGADKAFFYIGEGESFRVERSTLLKYKENRSAMQRPLLLDEVSEYLKKKFAADVITGYEVDDVVNMQSYRKPGHFQLVIDKDAYGAGGDVFNFHRPEEGIVKTDCFGKLWLNEKGDVRGVGRLFKLWQVCSEDSSDNYAANCFSDTKWAGKSAYNALVGCKDDREAFQASINIFKHLYPEPKEIVGWRGYNVQIDWLYVFQECFDMAHLHRWNDDFVNLNNVFDKLGIEF